MSTLNKFFWGVLFGVGLVWSNCGWSALVLLLEHIFWLFSSESKPVHVLWDYSDVNQNTVSRDDQEITSKVHSGSKQKC